MVFAGDSRKSTNIKYKLNPNLSVASFLYKPFYYVRSKLLSLSSKRTGLSSKVDSFEGRRLSRKVDRLPSLSLEADKLPSLSLPSLSLKADKLLSLSLELDRL